MKSEKEIIPILATRKANISREQKFFNSRVKKINKLKSDVEKLQALLAETRLKSTELLQPLEDKLLECRIGIVNTFDQAFDQKYFRKKEKAKLSELARERASQLIFSYGAKELIPIFDKHSEESYEQVNAENQAYMKDSFKEMAKESFGVELDLEDIEDMSDPSQFMEELLRQMDAQQDTVRTHFEQQSGQSSTTKKKKTKVQQEREDKQAEELKNISKAAKAIYTDLVKEYHPDRESDEQERERKTAIMQQITQAYGNDDLYELLRLKIELLGDGQLLDEVPEQQLKYYNKLLLDQIRELEAMKYGLKNPPPPYEHFQEYMNCRSLKSVAKKMQEEKEMLEEEVWATQDFLNYISAPKSLREWLKSYTLEADRPQYASTIFDLLAAQFSEEDDDFPFA